MIGRREYNDVVRGQLAPQVVLVGFTSVFRVQDGLGPYLGVPGR